MPCIPMLSEGDSSIIVSQPWLMQKMYCLTDFVDGSMITLTIPFSPQTGFCHANSFSFHTLVKSLYTLGSTGRYDFWTVGLLTSVPLFVFLKEVDEVVMAVAMGDV